MDKISFRGIEKLSYTKIINNRLIYPVHVKKALASQDKVLENLDVDLDRFMFVANDKGSKTLSELKEKYPDIIKDKNIVFDVATVRDPALYKNYTDEKVKTALIANETPQKLFFINGKKIEVDPSNMHFLGSFSRLFKSVAKSKVKPFVDDGYIKSQEYFNDATRGIQKYPWDQEEKMVENNFFYSYNDAQNVRPTLKLAADDIDNAVLELFA